jgi:uncharacterized membrane protein
MVGLKGIIWSKSLIAYVAKGCVLSYLSGFSLITAFVMISFCFSFFIDALL